MKDAMKSPLSPLVLYWVIVDVRSFLKENTMAHGFPKVRSWSACPMIPAR
jgi:hypothetical protein